MNGILKIHAIYLHSIPSAQHRASECLVCVYSKCECIHYGSWVFHINQISNDLDILDIISVSEAIAILED